MSSNKTEHLKLHSWVPTDMFTREEFNDNFDAIDAAVKAVREETAAAARAAQTAQSTADGRLRIQTGYYVGDGTAKSASDPMSIKFDFEPKFVILGTRLNSNIISAQYTHSPSAYPDFFLFTREIDTIYSYFNSTACYFHLVWSGNSVGWYLTSASNGNPVTNPTYHFNVDGNRYYWIAFG